MCRLLAVTARDAFPVVEHLRALAEIARTSPEYQGHGWGFAWQDADGWRTHHSIAPIWEEDLSAIGLRARALVAHARSAFRDEGIAVENNMPFVDGPLAFAFNGELQGVRIAEAGRIGAEKLFRFLVRLGAERSLESAQTALRLVAQRTRRVRAMNLVLGGSGRFLVSSSFSERPDYFTLHVRRSEGTTIVCSAPYPVEWGDAEWTPMANGSVEVIEWFS